MLSCEPSYSGIALDSLRPALMLIVRLFVKSFLNQAIIRDP